MTIVRRILTDPKTALAGVMLEISFARFIASMAMFNEEMVPSRPFGGWGFVSIDDTQGSDESTVLRAGREEGSGP